MPCVNAVVRGPVMEFVDKRLLQFAVVPPYVTSVSGFDESMAVAAMLVTLPGIVIVSNFVHPSKA